MRWLIATRMVIVMNIFRQQKKQPHRECNALSPFPFQQLRSLARLRAKYGEFRTNLLIAFAAYSKKNREIFGTLSGFRRKGGISTPTGVGIQMIRSRAVRLHFSTAMRFRANGPGLRYRTSPKAQQADRLRASITIGNLMAFFALGLCALCDSAF